MLHHPSLTFTIPSIHDDQDLDCRIYQPVNLSLRSSSAATRWAPSGAVVAHPYAPLGGSFDDEVVLLIVDELLKKGFLVGTFNFRGAAGSSGHTSWTGNAELGDYMSFIGLMYHYVHKVGRELAFHNVLDGTDSTLTPVPSNTVSGETGPSCSSGVSVTLLLAGYSYGALTTCRLPPTSAVVDLFSNPGQGDSAHEITLRAHRLGQETIKNLKVLAGSARGRSSSYDRRTSRILGGEEGEPGSRRTSRDTSTRRSIDSVRRSMERPRRHVTKRQQSHERIAARELLPSTLVSDETLSEERRVTIRTAYLLISPLLGPIASLATMSIIHLRHHAFSDVQVQKLLESPTLVVYGDGDAFTSKSRLRSWCRDLVDTGHATEPSVSAQRRFQHREIRSAGHFWREESNVLELRQCVASWLERSVSDGIVGDTNQPIE